MTSTTAATVPLLDLPGVLGLFAGAEHQQARVETLSAHAPGEAAIDLARCRCGRLFDAAGIARHLTESAP